MKRFLSIFCACVWMLVGYSAAHANPFDVVKAHRGVSTACSEDGHTGAPTGATVLYAARRAAWGAPPPCLIPDVDYAVGPDNDCASCVSPALASLPSGWSWNAGLNRLDCSGAASGSRVHHLDFTKLSGSGGGILINGCDNVTIDNIKMTRDCTNPGQPFPLKQLANSSGITITKAWLDGGSVAGAACGGGGDGEEIYLAGPGPKVVTYSRVINAAEHDVTFVCNGSDTSYARYNSFSATGYSQGAHDNGVQWLGTCIGADESWNYWYNPQPFVALDAAAGLTIDTNSGLFSVTLHFAAGITQSSLLEGMAITSANLQSGTTLINPSPTPPFTATLSKTATGTASGVPAAVPNAYPIGLVNPIRVANQSATGQMINVVLTGNVFDGDGPIKPGTNAISCGGDGTGLEVNGLVANQNYWLPAGYSGGFFLQAAFCINTVPSTTNKRLDDGTTITFP